MMLLRDIRIDPEFRGLLPPLPSEDRERLLASIMRDGFRDAVVVWQDHGVIIDGHHRHEIWQTVFNSEGEGPEVIEMPFPNRASVTEWIIKNQLSRRNLTDAQRVEFALRLKPIIAAKAKANRTAGVRLKSDEGSKPIDTLSEIAQVAGVSRDTVHKVGKVLSQGTPELCNEMREGTISINAAAKEAILPGNTKRRIKPLTDRDVYVFRHDVERTAKTLISRIRCTSKGAIRQLPGLARDLRDVSRWLSELADEVDAIKETHAGAAK